jgi:hypothetical protein
MPRQAIRSLISSKALYISLLDVTSMRPMYESHYLDMNRKPLRSFYTNPHVRDRIAEYLGAEKGSTASCIYLAQPDRGWPKLESVHHPEEMERLLADELDLSRSLWDSKSLIAHLDVEYVNFDIPHEPYLNPERTFRIQEPVHQAIEQVLAEYGIDRLHLMTGRGHHYVWRIPFDSKPFMELLQLGRCTGSLFARYSAVKLPMSDYVPIEVALAFAGLGLVMEHLANRIRSNAAPSTEVPIHLAAVTTPPGERGREMVAIDLSEYGDPLHLRAVRCPFTIYTKHLTQTTDEPTLAEKMLLTVVVPDTASHDQMIDATQNMETATRLAQETSAIIPTVTTGMKNLIEDYLKSDLRIFHDRFYDRPHDPPEQWESTYDTLPLHLLPPCMEEVLSLPNDRLTQPAVIESIVRGLLALGWHPRHIAGLIRSKFERHYDWGDRWQIHDAATQADFYTRIFSGSFSCGLDDLIDFTCLASQEKGLCLHPQKDCALESLKTSLLERRRHNRLAALPFNELFSPHEHA